MTTSAKTNARRQPGASSTALALANRFEDTSGRREVQGLHPELEFHRRPSTWPAPPGADALWLLERLWGIPSVTREGGAS